MDRFKKVYRGCRWRLAKFWLDLHPEVEVIGIAGSVGKTTTKDAIATVLRQEFGVVATEKNFDPIFNLPLSALKIRGKEKFVAELGIDGIGQMEKYMTLVSPKIGVLTRLSIEHTDSEHFGNLETAIREECKLTEYIQKGGWLIGNGDDEEINKQITKYKGNKYSYGFESKNDAHILNFKQKIKKDWSAESEFEIKMDGETNSFKTHLLGEHNALVAAGAFLVGKLMKMKTENIYRGLHELKPPYGRLNVQKSNWNGVIINDIYNASSAAVIELIKIMDELGGGVLVLGDMLELGDYAKSEHLKVLKVALESKIEKILCYGPEMTLAVNKLKDKRLKSFETHQEIVEDLKKMKPKLVGVKGSKGMKMGKVIEEII